MNKHSFSATLLVALFVLSLVLSPFSGVFAANGTNITTPYNSNNPFSPQTAIVGQLKEIDINGSFTDSLNRTLTYRVTGNNISPHTHVGVNSVNGHLTLYYTAQYAGEDLVTVIAEYIENDVVIDSASFDISISVDSAAPASSAQIDYDETDASDAITVYVTVSNDGIPILGNDGTEPGEGTVLACCPVEISWFPLSRYSLTDYNRCPDAGGDVIERPTLLHLYIYLLEHYYMGIDDQYCCQGTSGLLNYHGDTDVYYMDGSLAYSSGTSNYALSISGGAQSLYMTNFWGSNENLMYFRNHVYPLMSAGWGATADYILLSDGDYIDIAMFSNWYFMSDGAFLCFNSDVFVARTGLPCEFKTLFFPTSAGYGLPVNFSAMTDELNVEIYDDSWEYVTSLTYTLGSNSYYYTFTTPGDYYIVAKDLNADSDDACYAPAIAKIEVSQ